MNVVFLSSEYPLWAPGGIGTFIQTLGRSLAANGHQVTMLGIGDTYQEETQVDKGVTLIRLQKKQGKLPSFLHNRKVLNSKLKALHAEHPIDIIEASENGLALISRTHPAKKVIRLHGGHHFFAEAEKRDINWRKGLLEKRSFMKAAGFIAVSNYVKEHTANYLSYHNRPIKVIPHPIEMQVDISEKNTSNSILFAGTICEKKGVRELLQAFQIVREKHPDYHLDLYGRDWYYPDGSSYVETIKKEYPASFFERISFHGSVARDVLYKKYAEAAFCVFPSHMETQGLVTLEAMSLGKAVLFSKYGPGPETITHQENGLLCDVYDPGAIAAHINYLIENPTAREKLGAAAKEMVRAKYDKKTILEENLTFYSALLDG